MSGIAYAFPLPLSRKEEVRRGRGTYLWLEDQELIFSDSEALRSGGFYSDRSPADSVEMFLFSSDEVWSGGSCLPVLLPVQGLSPSVVLMY